ncbi:MAG: UDP-2,3-diacylglucosamine diphosphatase [Bacteroidales bacterium]|nr:UDP-2,3-diacylglucosamine diphosphatase [Bacteroidales bacterium]
MNTVFQNPIEVNGKCYFASDFHFGTPNEQGSLDREERVLAWLDRVLGDADALFLLGDIFDFWFEYKHVVPKGYYRLFAKFAELKQKHIPVYFFTGNHDMWVKDYFTKEFDFHIFREQQAFLINGKKCLVGHGDGLGKGDLGYKFIKHLFAFKPNVWLFGALPPRHAFAIANFFSRKSRAMTGAADAVFIDNDHEMLVQYALSVLQNEEIDFFIYGHRHLPLDIQLNSHSRYINTGDWLTHDSYCFADESGQLCLTSEKLK